MQVRTEESAMSDEKRLQVLVAAVEEDPVTLAEHMNLTTEAIICNQCNTNQYLEFHRKGQLIRVYEFKERGVGLNRNNGLLRCDAEFCLFSDEDIVYNDDYAQCVLEGFQRHPEADILMFNVAAVESRRTYENIRAKRVRWYNYGRYPTYSMACRVESLRRANVFFSLLYGGGARYSNGEDSLFIHDCLKKGLKIYGLPVNIGHENRRQDGDESTWFKGYNRKFFFDRGVLYHDLYGAAAAVFALRFLLTHRKKMCTEISVSEAFGFMREGIREGSGKTSAVSGEDSGNAQSTEHTTGV